MPPRPLEAVDDDDVADDITVRDVAASVAEADPPVAVAVALALSMARRRGGWDTEDLAPFPDGAGTYTADSGSTDSSSSDALDMDAALSTRAAAVTQSQ